jgi:hypothetical protein
MFNQLTRYYRNLSARAALCVALIQFVVAPAMGQIPKYNSNSSAPATVYLDFDGHTVQGTAWNWDSTIHARPSGLSTAVISEIFNRVAEDYRIFNINITTDSSVYAKAPVAKRVRVIITPTSKWYGTAGGISFVNSFTWGDGTPAWAFSDQLLNDPKYIGEACSHEAGHTLGLQHQSTWNNTCGLVAEYAEGRGDGEIGWAPIMGVSYYQNVTTWNIGTSVEGCSVIQNDITVISQGLNNIGLRVDENGNTMASATPLNVYGTSFASSGMISTASDVDAFKFVLGKPSLFKTKVAPGNVGTGNAGANIDIKISLVKDNGDTIGRYNPTTLLSASIDTNLLAGTYYMVVDGAANQYTTDYNSIGYYTISGGIDAVLPVKKLVLKGQEENSVHSFSWVYEADEPVTSTSVECSTNGIDFKTIGQLSPAVNTYVYHPRGNGAMYYRIKMLTGPDDEPYYSNIISLQCALPGQVTLSGNIIQNSALISVPGDYTYELMDETGRLFQRGKLSAGYNTVPVNNLKKGIMLLRVYSGNDRQLFKLIKQ